MLLRQATLDGIFAGRIDTVYRRWKRPTVRAGGTLKTRAGLLAIEEVERVSMASIKAADARAAGYQSRAELMRLLAEREGTVYRIKVRVEGDDPRIALRGRAITGDAEFEQVQARLARMDRASKSGPWTRQYLELIERNEAVRAPDLAAGLGLEKKVFKARVRRLKNLGLTESLKVGYRISARGRSYLARV